MIKTLIHFSDLHIRLYKDTLMLEQLKQLNN